jgi:hypothetical protein
LHKAKFKSTYPTQDDDDEADDNDDDDDKDDDVDGDDSKFLKIHT